MAICVELPVTPGVPIAQLKSKYCKFSVLKYCCWSSRQKKLNSRKFLTVQIFGMKITRAKCIQRQPFWMLYSWLGSLLVLICDVNLKLLQAKGCSSGSWRIIVKMFASASDHAANKAVEKFIIDKSLDKKLSKYFIFIVVWDAASSFILFHSIWSLF